MTKLLSKASTPLCLGSIGVVLSICTWYAGGTISFDDLCFVFRAFQTGDRGWPQSGNGKAPDTRDVTRSTTATHMPELHCSVKNAKK